jgi:transcriptional antiterminator RfaH
MNMSYYYNQKGVPAHAGIGRGFMKPSQANWFAVVTKPRQEQIALENLQRQAFECFLPMAENPFQRRSKKQQKIIEPLFPRYLFLKAIAEFQNLAPVRSTQGVISMVRFGTELAVIPEQIINAIKQRVSPDTGLIKIQPLHIKPGDKVRVFDGPFSGLTGIAQEECSARRIIILMELLGRPTKVQVETLNLQRTA